MSIKQYINKFFPIFYQQLSIIAHERRINKNKKKWDKDPEEALRELYDGMIGNSLGISLDFNNVKRYTEKIQLRKLYHNKMHSKLSDKYEVRKWVSNKVGDKYLIPLVGVWNNFDEIDFDKLPDSFVMKTNNASGTNVIISDKNKINIRLLKSKFDYWIKMQYWYYMGYEMHYQNIKPKIIAEKFIKAADGTDDLNDYKFLCFDGKVEYIWVDSGRYHNHKRATFDRDWNVMPFNQNEKFSKNKNMYIPTKPENFEEMLSVAETLAEGFDHVRVDLYNNGGKIYFGEMTFTNGCGYIRFVPDKYDFILGEKWDFQKEGRSVCR